MTSSYANYKVFTMNEINRTDNIFHLIRYLNKLIATDFDKRLSECGLTGQQGRILFFVYCKTREERIEIHQNDIENEFHLSKSTVSGLVKRMEKKGFIKIEKQHPYAVIKVTKQGEETITHLRKNRRLAINHLLQDVDEKDKDKLVDLLEKLISNMEGGN